MDMVMDLYGMQGVFVINEFSIIDGVITEVEDNNDNKKYNYGILLTNQRLIDFTTVLGNVDIKLFASLIPSAADQWIMPRTGTHFFNDLLTNIMQRLYLQGKRNWLE